MPYTAEIQTIIDDLATRRAEYIARIEDLAQAVEATSGQPGALICCSQIEISAHEVMKAGKKHRVAFSL